MRLIFRALALTIPRFAVLIGMLLALQYLDVSPLPDWTLIVFAYLLHFLITYLFARWTFTKHTPEVKDWIAVAAVFVIFGTALEAGLYLVLTRGSWSDLLRNYRWQSLYLVALYVVAVFTAGYSARRAGVKKSLPEGLEA